MNSTDQTVTQTITQNKTKDIAAMLHRLPVLRAVVRTHNTPSTDERLAAELSDYRSDADRNDLNALLDEYPDSEAAPIRELLNRHALAA